MPPHKEFSRQTHNFCPACLKFSPFMSHMFISQHPVTWSNWSNTSAPFPTPSNDCHLCGLTSLKTNNPHKPCTQSGFVGIFPLSTPTNSFCTCSGCLRACLHTVQVGRVTQVLHCTLDLP